MGKGYFGEDSFSAVVVESLIKAGHEIAVVVIPKYNSNAYLRLYSLVERYGLKWILEKDINSPIVVAAVENARPDIGILVHFAKIIRDGLLKCASMGFINFHPSRLPYYRGLHRSTGR